MDVDKLGERTVGILTKPDLAKDDKVFHDIVSMIRLLVICIVIFQG